MLRLSKILILILIFGADIFAQSFTASVDRNNVPENEAFQISFVAKGTDINGFGNFAHPDFSNFRIISGPIQSTSMSIINGAVSASVSYSYYLRPVSQGTFTIGSASIQYKGKTFKTNPVSITVTKAEEPVTPPPTQNQQQSAQQNKSTGAKSFTDDLFIRAVPDKEKVYKGEQVTISYKIYTRHNISAPSVSKAPSFTGFWSEDLETSRSIVLEKENFNGKQFSSGVLKKVALFPTQTGKITVNPMELSVNVSIQKQRRRGDIFDEFFNDPFFGMSEIVEQKLVANPVNIEVLPLPANAPLSFKGAVGNFSFKAEANKNSVKMNEPVTIKFTVAGTGNIELIEIPELELPSGFEKYEPKINKSVNRSGKISGQKTVEYLLIPRAPGEKQIPSIEFSYFDPNKKEYVTLNSQPIKINVEKGDGSSDQNYAYRKEDVSLLGNDIRFIKTSSSNLKRSNGYLVNSMWFWIAAFFPLFVLFVAVARKNKNEKLNRNVQLLKYQKAEKFAKNELKSAKLSLEKNDQEGFYTDISQALFGYLENKLSINKAEFTVETAILKLKQNGVPEDLSAEVKKTLEYCEFARFAPQSGSESAMKDMYERAVNIIMDLEKYLSTKKNKFF